MTRSLATVILAGGKGTRMGSSEKHKVCFEVLGVPVIIRALETYNLCGSGFNIVVVGMLAENVMATVNRRFPGTAYAFQERPLGTGDAARKGAEILERMRFSGDVLVVAGDKVIDPRALRQILALHERTGADVTLATARRSPDSNAGILLKSARGNLVGILEEAERQRLLALAELNEALQAAGALAPETVARIVAGHCGERTARRLLAELGSEDGSALRANPPAGTAGAALDDALTRQRFERLFSQEERLGLVRIGAETLPAGEVLTRFDQENLSVYLFRAPVLYDALNKLRPTRSSQEEYLTDVIEILANRPKPARMVGCEIVDRRDLMAFNNPQELLAIEETYRQREGQLPGAAPSEKSEAIALPAAWDNLLNHPSAAAGRQFRQWYGEEIPWARLREVLAAFVRRYGGDRPVAIVRSPGRINLLGRHIDHQGGTVNVMAINREVILVAAPRADDVVSLANSNGSQFSEQTFRISDLVAHLDWDDWQRVIDGPRLARLLEAARGDWANYVKAAVLRLQEQFRNQRLRGLDLMVSGDIPMGAGLSSSSALVVATADAVCTFNSLPVSARRLVSLCGESEWFVGTRGGAADHAAIKLSHRGCVTRVGFFPFQLEDSAPFFPGHDLVVCNSGLYAGKSRNARNTFNAKVTAYHIGRVWSKMLRPDLAPRIEHLRDLQADRLGLTQAEFAQLLSQLPERITRAQVQAAFTQMAQPERERLERLFLSHDAPPAGYAVRGVVLFGLSEMARARRCLDLLKQNDAAGLGHLMRRSHDGDRVARETSRHTWKRAAPAPLDRELAEWAARTSSPDSLGEIPGAYGCSLPELDRIVDLAGKLPGVEGAQLAGAGLGGCIMVLVQKPFTDQLLTALQGHGIQAEVFRPIAGACSLTLT